MVHTGLDLFNVYHYCLPMYAQTEIVGTWINGIFIFYPPHWYSGQSRMYAYTPDGDIPSGDIEAGDFTGDGIADVASCWSSGLWFQDESSRSWTWLSSDSPPRRLTTGNVARDKKKEIIGTYGDGVYYFDWDGSRWWKHRITSYVAPGDIAAGDITGDGWDEVVAGFGRGTWYWNPRTGGWTQTTTYNAYNLACGDGNGDGRAEVVVRRLPAVSGLGIGADGAR